MLTRKPQRKADPVNAWKRGHSKTVSELHVLGIIAITKKRRWQHNSSDFIILLTNFGQLDCPGQKW